MILNKILLVGNHTCGNRGDGAILRGLISEIRRQQPQACLTILSRFPESSAFLLNQPVEPDQLHRYRQRKATGFVSKVCKFLTNRLLSNLLYIKAKYPRFSAVLPLPKVFKAEINRIKDFDLVIQVGGSFFVDVYGAAQFDYALITLQSNIPYYILGHSVGPFQTKVTRKLAQFVFNQCQAFVLREEFSLTRLQQDHIEVSKVAISTDTAWLVDSASFKNEQNKQRVIAVTLRELTPFDRILGISQSEYEKAFVDLIDKLNEQGYLIRAFSTCTGIDGYPKDDRMVALRVQAQCQSPEKIEVIMDELNDEELGQAFSKCILTVGTRLHSAIISMNFGTPAFALNYEHKSAGIMHNLGLDELAQPISALVDGSLVAKVIKALSEIEVLQPKVYRAVLEEKEKARDTIKQLFS